MQVLQWMFAAAPGHPALRDICDHIAGSVDTKFTGNKNFDTLERTGPGAFTDVILKHAELHPLSKASHIAISFSRTSFSRLKCPCTTIVGCISALETTAGSYTCPCMLMQTKSDSLQCPVGSEA